MISAGELKGRLCFGAGVSERLRERNPYVGGYNHQNFQVCAGTQNWPLHKFVLEACYEYTASDRTNGGAFRKLATGRIAYKIPVFWYTARLFGAEWSPLQNIDIVPLIEAGGGSGEFDAYAGLDPAPGSEALLRGGALLSYTHTNKHGYGLEVGAGFLRGRSFQQEYDENRIGVQITTLIP